MRYLLLLIVLAVVVVVIVSRQQRSRRELEARERSLTAVRRVAGEDVTRFGEELQALDADVAGRDLDAATRQDYQRALDCYEQSKQSLDAVTDPAEVRHVTEVLEDGRYAIACVQTRLAGQPLPTRRSPCFFNPAHGPSTQDVSWAPPGGQPREVPVCAADAERVEQGAEPDIRTVMSGPRKVPYWQGGAAYGPYTQGYFGAYAIGGLLPGLLVGSLLADGWGGYDAGYDAGYGSGYDDAADSDGNGAGDGDGGDYGTGDGGDFGGDGGDFGGGGGDFGGGGGDFGGGGGDFGGDFGGFDV